MITKYYKTPVNLLLVFSLFFTLVSEVSEVNIHEIEINDPESQIIDSSRDKEGDTFSVVAYDPNTGQVGGAACSCVGFNGGIDFLNDLIVDGTGTIIGGINSQAAYNATTQARARTRMLAGDTPQEIINFVVASDGSSASRQYGVVGFDGASMATAGFTGSSNGHFGGHLGGTDPVTGITYAIQGNILDNNNASDNANGQDVLNDMEASFLAAEGTLADKLMAALQGAKRVAGDSRCNSSTNSGRSAFIRVLSPGEGDNNPGLYYNTDDISGQGTTSGVPNFTEPIDKLQDMFDDGEGVGFCKGTINTFPYAMDFETNMWERDDLDTNPNDDDRSWMRDRSPTPTGSTGPNGPNQGTFFAYLESSSITGAGDEAAIASPCFEIPVNMNAQITFDYNMNGANMGTMRLEANTGTGGWVQLWSDSGNQGNTWFNNELVDLSAYRGKTVKLRFRGNRNGGNAGDMAIDDINISLTAPSCNAATIYDSGWNNSKPVFNSSATIRSNYSTTSSGGSIEACELTVTNNATLTISAGDYLNVYGNITVDAGSLIIIEHQGSLAQIDDSGTITNNGIINVNVDTPPMSGRDFMLMGSPMSSETRADAFGSALRVRNHLTGNFTPNAAVAATSPGAGNWLDEEGDDWPVYNGAITPGEGYMVMQSLSGGPTSYSMTYDQGTLNNGVVTYTAGFNGTQNASPNIIANPYASAISATDFINGNANVDAVYFWEHVTTPTSGTPGPYGLDYTMEDISIFNLTGGTSAAGSDPTTTPNGIISTGQGFGIKALSAGTITFNNAMRRTDGNTTLRNFVERDRIWLNVQTDRYELNGTALIGFIDEATEGLDTGYDAKRLATNVSLYSHLADGSNQLGIQARGAFQESIKIPMGFSTLVDEPVSYTISIENIEGLNLSNQTVYLIDNQEQAITNLSETNYTFVSGKGIFDGRFTLQFTPEVVLGSNDTSLDTIAIYPNPTQNVLNIVSPKASVTSVEIYDVRGRQVLSTSEFNSNNSITLDLSELNRAIYFIEINTEEGKITKRILKQ